MSSTKREELDRLAACQQIINDSLQSTESRLNAYATEIRETKEHMWEARRDLDHIDKVALRQVIDQKSRSAQILGEQREKLLKLRKSPYFGRFDFVREGGKEPQPVYVGVHNFFDDEESRTVVHDWRAPISSMFYDFEIGPARYEAPSGEIHGRLDLKRQFRIRNGRMEFMLDSGVNIIDDVLQEELSRSSDEGMRNIVATIQRDQNAIIRDADVQKLIIQGVAGSGKTSIALHRIAFLLYRFKDTLTADDILIISPNRVFADYIGNVLPELGEQQVREIGMETLADELLEGKYTFQTFFEQTAQLLEKNDEALKARIAAKSSLDFLKRIDAYVNHLEASSIKAVQWRTGRCIVPDWFFDETWRKHAGMPFTERVARAVDAAEHQIGIHYNYDLRTDERRSLREAVRAMVSRMTPRDAYKNLFTWLGEADLFKPAGGKLEYADVFPLIHLKMKLEGVENPRNDVKHLLIDEMQDYTPVQYAVLSRLFNCRMTILGDASQSVSPYGAAGAEAIQKILRTSRPVKLTKSYRSTWEIMLFALAISPQDDLEPMKRHGEPPKVMCCARPADVKVRLMEEVEDFLSSPHTSLAIIAKTQKQVDKLHRQIQESGTEARRLDASSAGFSNGIVLCTAHLAKGLEFDRVIVPDANAETYHTELDRNMLYVACTRAMHRLTAIAAGTPSAFLPAPGDHQHDRAKRES